MGASVSGLRDREGKAVSEDGTLMVFPSVKRMDA